jgi:hypothetical protein
MIKSIISAKSFIWILFFSIFFTSNVLADDLNPYVITGNLRSQAITAKSAGNPTYLQPALGQAVLTFIYEGQTYNLTTGLVDTQPLVRQKAASLIAELGDPIVDSYLISALQTKLSSERDAQTKGFLFNALTSLQLKAQTSIANKVNFVNTFLATYDPQIQGVEALFSICSQVRDQGLQVASALTIFKNARLAQLPELNTYINDTLTILSLYGQNSGQALYEQAIGNASDGVRLWAINKLVNTNTPEFQVYANNILLKLWKDKSDVFFNLQGAIEKSEILRSENLNSCLEFTSGNVLQNWQVTQSDGLSTTAIDTTSAYSFAKCLKIINKSGSTL